MIFGFTHVLFHTHGNNVASWDVLSLSRLNDINTYQAQGGKM
jgi:hypothetical protein